MGRGIMAPKRVRKGLTWDQARQLLELLVRAIEPVARLIDALSRIK